MRHLSVPFGVVAIGLLLLTGCAMAPQLTPMQIRQITTREIEGGYEDVYRATMAVLQDNGYVISNTDMASGLVVGRIDKETSGGSQFMQALFIGHVADKARVYEASCMVSKLNESRSDVRIVIQSTTLGQSSSFSGTSRQNSTQIYDAATYKTLFDAITVEAKRREAMNRPVGALVPLRP